MGSQFASGRRSIAFCDRCGRKVDYRELKDQIVNQTPTGIRVCTPCLDKDHPQYRVGNLRITDPQALRYTRPDPNLVASRDIFWGWNPIGMARSFDSLETPNTLVGIGEVGELTVVTNT